MEGEWKQRRGQAVQLWGKVMNDDLAAIAGKYEELVGRLQESNGIANEEANQQVTEFKKTIAQLRKSNGQLVRLQESLRRKDREGGKRVSSRNQLRETTRRRPGD